MSRRRLERGYWNGRQVQVTDKEHDRIYVRRPDRNNRYYHRHGVMMHMSWPWPTSFELDHRLPRKTKKALWKQFNGHPRWDETETYGPSVIHNGTKRKAGA